MFTRDGLMWQQWELEILRNESNTAKEIARAVNRDVECVRSKASKLKIPLVRHICTRCGESMTKYAKRYRCRPCDNAYERNRRKQNA